MRILAALLLTAATMLHAQAPTDDPSQDHLRFTLILSGPGASTPLASLLPPSTRPDPCQQPSDIYLYSATDPQLITATHAASATIGTSCPAPPVYISQTAISDTLFTTQSSNLLAHILDTLQQAAATPAAPAAAVLPVDAARVITSVTDNPPPTAAALASPAHDAVKAEAKQPATTVPPQAAPPQPAENRINGAFGPAGTRLVYIAAPDASIAQLAALLGLPSAAPGTQLIFQLTQKHHKKSDLFPPWKIQVLTRSASAAAPAAVKGCKATGCDLPIFLHTARAAVDPTQTTLDVPPTLIAPEPGEKNKVSN